MSKYTASKVVKVAYGELGYCEKKSNASLDSKTANAGSNNYTKYGRDMHKLLPKVMDFPAAWCDCFNDWCHWKASGEDQVQAKAALCGNFDDYTVYSADYYKDAKRWGTKPKLGAQIFFKSASGGICHTGIVIGYGQTGVRTIEGNTSSASGVVDNGGCVAEKYYSIGYSRIAGYGYPKYSSEPKATGKYKVLVSKAVRADSAKASKKVGTVKSGTSVTIEAIRINKYGNTWGYSDKLGGWIYIGKNADRVG